MIDFAKSCGRLSRPWLWLSSRAAHDSAPQILPLISWFWKTKNSRCMERECLGLKFNNPMGIAGGVDKTGSQLIHWQKMGAGFVEIGTVTPQPQEPNPGKIMDRSLKHWALWNKMGFPSPGVEVVAKTLRSFHSQKRVPLFINIGKNRTTPNEEAAADYVYCLKQLQEFADAFVINISSPNTKGLRDLQSEDYLQGFLQPIVQERDSVCPGTPLLLKLSPDISSEELHLLLKSSKTLVDGWILTNTTQAREPGMPFPKEGGVSGYPLCETSRDLLRQANEILGSERKSKLLISVGGILGAEEIKTRLEIGADLVQVYSALVLQGPGFFAKAIQSLKE